MSRFTRCLHLALTDRTWLLRASRFALNLYREQGGLGLLAKIDPLYFSAPLYRLWLNRYPIPRAPKTPSIRVALLLTNEGAPSDVLKASVNSILKQQHTNWELWIAQPNASLSLPELAHDLRINFIATPATRVAQLNCLLHQARGELVLPFRAGQLLHAELLSWLSAIFANGNLQVARWDSDQIDALGRRNSPNYHPSWDDWLARSTPCFCAPMVLRRELLLDMGGYAKDSDNACEYDLLLRLIERLQPKQFRHLPLILSHQIGNYNAIVLNTQHQVSLDAHFVRSGILAQTRTTLENTFQIRLLPSIPYPAVAIVMPTRDGGKHLHTAVTSLFERTNYPLYHLYLVDNGSTDSATLGQLKRWANDSRCTVLRDPDPFNFAALNNRAVTYTNEPLLCMLNDDIEIITSHWLNDMVGALLQPGVGAAGARLWYPQGGLQHAGVIVGYGGGAGHAHKACHSGEGLAQSALLRGFSAVTAACFVTHRHLFIEQGGLDAKHFPINFNDVDYCLKLREAGQHILYVPSAELIHHESASRGIDSTSEQRKRFACEVASLRTRWAHWIVEDPAYNPNLTLLREDYSLAWPPRRSAWLQVEQ